MFIPSVVVFVYFSWFISILLLLLLYMYGFDSSANIIIIIIINTDDESLLDTLYIWSLLNQASNPSVKMYTNHYILIEIHPLSIYIPG